MASTIQDVARLAGCSITTVSRVYSAPEKVRDETREKVYAAAKALQYSPNAIARAMVLQQNHSIAFVIDQKQYPVSHNPFYLAISEAVQQEAEKWGYQVYITSNSAAAQSSDLFMHKRVDGVIFAGQTDPQFLMRVHAQGMPIVLVNNDTDLDGVASIVSDDYHGTVQAIEHLIARGHRRIGLISGNLFPYISATRYRAFLDTMAAHQLTVEPAYSRTVEPTREDALRCVQALLQTETPPTALFCMNDQIAIGAIKAALRLGLRVPESLAVVGFDGSAVCTVIEPELTSVSVDTAAMGRLGAQTLIGMIGGKPPKVWHTELGTTLKIRQST